MAEAAANECIVDSITLNDLEGTDLAEQLDQIRRGHGGQRLRVGAFRTHLRDSLDDEQSRG